MLRTAVAVSAPAVCLAFLAFLAGCGSATETADPTPTRSVASPTPSRTPTPTATPSPTPTPTASPKPKPKPRPKPKDGSDLDACYDGRCEVLVTKPATITLDGRLGVPYLDISSISSDGVDFRATTSGGMSTGMLGQRPDQGGPSQLNDLKVWVIWLGEDSAVIRLAPA